MWLMLQQEQPQDYVIGTNTAYTIKDLCRIAFAHADLDWQAHVTSDERFIRPTEINAARGNYAKAKRDLGWEPRTTFEELIQLMVDEDLRLLAARSA
jgi:GDPmannose 4,6-dehydratase